MTGSLQKRWEHTAVNEEVKEKVSDQQYHRTGEIGGIDGEARECDRFLLYDKKIQDIRCQNKSCQNLT
jgi:hypothetical protein